MLTRAEQPGHWTSVAQSSWRFAPADATDAYLIHSRSEYPFRDLDVAVDDPALRASFAAYNRLPWHEHVIWFRQPVVLEPTYGFALTGPRTLLLQSMPYHERVGLPAFGEYLWRRYGRREPIRRERCVISLREFGDDNYYHFYSDVLGRLALLERWPETADLPIVISGKLARSSFFQQAVARGELRRRRFIVHQRGFIHAESIVLPMVLSHSRATFDTLLGMLQSPPAEPSATRRIFLTRRPDHRRYLVNAAEVAALCADFGFETVDTGDMDLDAQMRCFAGARYVVGTHGAGLVNMIFRRGAPLGLLELFPPDNIPPHYFWLCRQYGYGYDALVGTSAGAAQEFYVDPQRLRARLARLLTNNELRPAQKEE